MNANNKCQDEIECLSWKAQYHSSNVNSICSMIGRKSEKAMTIYWMYQLPRVSQIANSSLGWLLQLEGDMHLTKLTVNSHDDVVVSAHACQNSGPSSVRSREDNFSSQKFFLFFFSNGLILDSEIKDIWTWYAIMSCRALFSSSWCCNMVHHEVCHHEVSRMKYVG